MTLETLRLTKNRVLVLLPPAPEVDASSGLILAEALPVPISYGRVLRTGPLCRDVHEGDMVAFPPEVGDPLALTEAHTALFLRESDVAALIPKRHVKGQA